MAPNKSGRRNDHHHNNEGHNGAGGAYGGGGSSRPMKCCVPTECSDPSKLIYREDIGSADIEVVKVVCNNEACEQGVYMHRECFELWEQTVLTYLKSCGRARSWSEKQRLQNLWTKRGYDLAFKACSCKCGKGHLRKDLDWTPPPRTVPIAIPGAMREEVGEEALAAPPPQPAVGAEKKKKKGKKEGRPTLALSAPVPHPNNNNAPSSHPILSGRGSVDSGVGSLPKSHAPPFGSLGSSTSSGSFDLSSSSPTTNTGLPMARPRMNSVSSNGSGSSGSSGGGGSPPSPDGAHFSPSSSFTSSMGSFPTLSPLTKFARKNSKGIEIPERTRYNNPSSLMSNQPHAHAPTHSYLRDSGASGIFSKRLDFSSFNRLPRHKLNSYHIKMEDEAHGNDETRAFVLATLNAAKINRVSCVLCSCSLIIFDRYPLIDGTFFLSPRQHSHSSVEVRSAEGKLQFLSGVCMGCLEGWQSVLFCRNCSHRWDGSDLVLGTCYTYDIFAATPCCRDRLCCSQCKGLLMLPEQRPVFFSEYSHSSICPHCGLHDYHLAKRLPEIFDKASNTTIISH